MWFDSNFKGEVQRKIHNNLGKLLKVQKKFLINFL